MKALSLNTLRTGGLLLVLLCSALVTVDSQTSTLAGGDATGSDLATTTTPDDASAASRKGLRPKVCPKIACIFPGTCPPDKQVCRPIVPGCPCCPTCPPGWDKSPPPPAKQVPAPPPPLVCPQFFYCAASCAKGQTPYCFEPHPAGCPCCLGCRGPAPPPVPPSVPPPPSLLSGSPPPPVGCSNPCLDKCRADPASCINVVCPLYCVDPQPLGV